MRETAREQLRSIKRMEAENNAILRQISRLRERMEYHSATIDGLPKGSRRYTLADYVGDLDELIELLEISEVEYIQAYKDVVWRIRQIKDPQKRTILEEKYLNGSGMNYIAALLCLSPSRVYHLHLEALDEYPTGEEEQ